MLKSISLKFGTYFLLLSLLILQKKINAQGTTCAGATSITLNGACLTAQSITDNSPNTPTNTCGPVPQREGWYVFTTAGTTATVSFAAGNRNPYIEVFNGCSGSSVGCINANTGTSGHTETLNLSGLSVGSNYYIKIMNSTNNDMSGTLCVSGSIAPPSNDDPSGATSIPVSASCSYTTFSNSNATASTCGTIPAPGCASYSTADVWFSVTVPASGTVIFDTQTGTITDGGMAIYLGTPCGVMTLIGCDDDSSPNGAMPSYTVTGQTPGTTLYARVWDFSDGTGTFGLCASTVIPPTNDNCSGAFTVSVNSNTLCASTTTGTTTNATQSLAGCTGNADDDVWFSFVASATTQSITTTPGTLNNIVFEVFSGTCGALTSYSCINSTTGASAESSPISGLTIGTTYFVRVYSNGNNTNVGTFSVCINVPPAAPANDECTGATVLTVNSGSTCTTSSGGTLAGATTSSQSDACGGGVADDDVWYKFTATATTHSISITNVTGSLDMYHSVYGGTCGSIGAPIICSDPNMSFVSGLTIGNVYYVRVYSYTGTAGQTATFSVCVLTPPPPPANDDCTGATVLTVNSGSTCTTSSGGTVLGATASSQIDACGGGADDDDVWYKFTATATSHSISITNVSGSVTDMYHSVYGGTCGSIGTPLVCSDPNMSFVSGLTIGNVYYVRIYTYSSTWGQTTTFSVCVLTPPPPPANDDCTGATTITANSGTNCASPTGGTVLGATASSQGNTCIGTADDDVWYKFTATSTSHSVTISNIAGSVTNLNHAVYAGTCGSIGTPLICSDPNSSIVFGLTVGNVYYIRVYTSSSTWGQTTTFSICVTTPLPPPANDDCTGATTLAISSGTTCSTLTGGTLLGATPSSQTDACGGGLADDDVWYKFTATATSHSVSISNVAGSVTDLYHSIYGGTCASIGSPIICNDANSSLLSGLTIGNVYYVRIYSYSSTWGQTTTFSVCVTTPPDPCASITNIASCGTSINTTIAAGNGVYSSSDCGFATDGNEKIFSYTPSASGTYSIQQGSSFTYIDYQIKQASGGCGNSGWTCINDLSGAVTSPAFTMSAGVQYYFLLDPENNSGGSITFTLVCPPPPPSNDNCTSATTLAVSSGTTCTTLTGGTLLGATSSTQANACDGTADDDVWYSFTASATTHSISLSNVSGSQDMYHSLYAGTCSSIGTPIMCSDPNTSVVTGLTIGSVYYIRIYSYGTTLNLSTTFSLCVTTPTVPPPPANDNCSGAYPVTVNSGTTCTSLTNGTLYGATASTQANSCGGTIDDDDVWYSFVATSTYHKITLNNIAGSTTDLYHSVYAGTCGSIGNAIICSDLNTSGVNGLTIGNTYYVRVYTAGTTWGATTTFSVCVTTPPAPPLNTSCSGMTPICSGSSITFEAQSSGGTAAPGPDYDCLSTQPNPTWFYMEILTPGTMAIDMSAGSDIDFALWGPYPNLTAAQADCSTYPVPIDCSYSTSNTEQANIASVLEGEVYALLVTNYADIIQNITLSQASGASATTNCAIVLPVNLLYFNATINELDNVDLDWATETEQNSSYFDIEKSLNGKTWHSIGTKPGKGNSSIRTAYHHTDNKPNNEIQYYRLKQFDFDGSYKYSQIVSVDLSDSKEQIINVHPNPTNDIINYEIITNNQSLIHIELVSYTGLNVLEKSETIEPGKNSFNISLSNLPNGVYLLKVKIEKSGKTLIQKIIKN